MGKAVSLKNFDTKVFFTNTLSSGVANDFVAITTNISNVDTTKVNVGFQIKNISTDASAFFYIKHANTSHGNNTGFKLNIGESILVECEYISDLYVKSNTDTTISLQVIGN